MEPADKQGELGPQDPLDGIDLGGFDEADLPRSPRARSSVGDPHSTRRHLPNPLHAIRRARRQRPAGLPERGGLGVLRLNVESRPAGDVRCP